MTQVRMEDTIAAISTPLGEGGLAVVRVSGPEAVAVADRCFAPSGKAPVKPSAAPTHTVQHGRILHAGRVVDEVMLAVFRAPRTFTREDMVEVSCHGGLLPAKLVLDAVLEQGVRLAEPGEFTKRAFLNGRIDLAQAEAVLDLIQARTEWALAAAHEQLAGSLSRRINRVREELLRILAHLEAHIDFPDEDLAPDTRQQLAARLEEGAVLMEELLRSAHEGQVLRRGLRAALVGRPNVGKSSLLNALLGRERAIVSPHPGTTRDTIEETANIRGLPVVFIDTAGLREARDSLEEEGIRRSREALARADLVLLVLDASAPLTAEDERYLAEFTTRPRLLICNKRDLPAGLRLPGELKTEAIEVSCVTGAGVERLKNAIKEKVWAGEIRAEMLEVMINSRHQDALRRAQVALGHTLEALRQERSLELAALDLRIAVNAVGEVIGKTVTDDLLDSIFSQFCIGK